MSTSTWTQGDIDVDGVRLRFHRTGSGDLPPLVLAHGLSDNGLCWGRAASELQSHFDVVMLDARNHGASDTAPATPELLASDVAAAIGELRLERPAVMGHSVGAHTAALLAGRTDGVVSRLVLEDPPWTADHQTSPLSDEAVTTRRRQVRTWLSSLGEMTDDEMAELGRTQHGDWPAEEFPAWIESNRQVRVDAADGLATGGWGETVSAIGCPTLLVYGEAGRGGIVTPGVASRITELNGDVTAQPVPNAGHNIRRENFDQFIHHVTAFLRSS